MEEFLQRVEENFQHRLNDVRRQLEEHSDWEILNRVLRMRGQDCYDLFRKPNETIECVENLYSMLVNGLLDDSSLAISITGKDIFTFMYVSWGNYDLPEVSENDLHKMIDIIDERKDFLEKHGEDEFSEDRELVREYFEFNRRLENMMYGLASDEVKERWDAKEKAKEERLKLFENI